MLGVVGEAVRALGMVWAWERLGRFGMALRIILSNSGGMDSLRRYTHPKKSAA